MALRSEIYKCFDHVRSGLHLVPNGFDILRISFGGYMLRKVVYAYGANHTLVRPSVHRAGERLAFRLFIERREVLRLDECANGAKQLRTA